MASYHADCINESTRIGVDIKSSQFSACRFVITALLLFLLSTGTASAAHYPDLNADIPWSAGYNGVADIQAAFNNARSQENAQLSTSIPLLTMPSQAAWDAMSDGEKALWLLNKEREDRGIHLLEGLETNVQTVAQDYADWLFANNETGHVNDVDGDAVDEDPWDRLHDDTAIAPPAITACHDFMAVGENLAYFWSTGGINLPIERAIYGWTYDDSSSGWGHRHFTLWYTSTPVI